MLQIQHWNNSSSKLYARLRGTGGRRGEKSGAPCVTPDWNGQLGQQVVWRLSHER